MADRILRNPAMPLMVPREILKCSPEAQLLYLRIASGEEDINSSQTLNELLEIYAVHSCPHCRNVIVR